MQVSTETLSALERQITITLLPQQIEQAVDKELQHQAKRMTVNGFRPGKVPFSLVKRQQGEAIRRQVRQQLVQDQFKQAVEQQSLCPVGYVSFSPDPVEVEEGSYQANFEIYPEIVLQELCSIELQKPQISITEQDINDHLQKMRRMLATWSPVQRSAERSDRVTINFTATVDGSMFEGGEARNWRLSLSENQLLDGFVEGIIGHKSGEEFSFEATFPSDYADPNLKGKQAQFIVQLIQVEAATLPELDEKTLHSWGIEEGTLEKLHLTINKILEEQATRLSQEWVRQQLEDNLLKLHQDLLIPKRLVEQELFYYSTQLKEKENRDLDKSMEEQCRQQIKRRIALRLLLGEVVKQRSLELEQERFFQRIEQEMQRTDEPQKLLAQLQKQPDYTRKMRQELLEEQAIDLLIKEAVVVEKVVTLAEIVQLLNDNEKVWQNSSGNS